MSNKLKDVFSNKMFELGGRLNFEDMEARNAFLDALKIVQDEGRTVKLDGVSSISTSAKDGNMEYPFMIEGELTHVVIGPSIDTIPITINTDSGKKLVNFRRYETSNKVILETGQREIVFFKFTFNKGGHNLDFAYRMQPQFAKNTKDVAEAYDLALGIVNYFFNPTIEQNVTESIEILDNIKKSFQITSSFWKKLNLIENELNVSFDPAQIGNINDNVTDVQELYLWLVEKKIVRLNEKLTSTESTGITLEHDAHTPEIGSTIAITFTREIEYSICGQSIIIYTANLLINAIIKEIVKNENGIMRILYSDTESMPMYISCIGFQTPQEADTEHNLIMKSDGLKEKYMGALTINEYLRQEQST